MLNFLPFLTKKGVALELLTRNLSCFKLSNKRFQFIIGAAICCMLISSTAIGQLGVYSFTGTAACPTQNPNVTNQPADAAFTPYTISSSITCTPTANLQVTQGWGTGGGIDLNKYNQFTITPNTGNRLTLTSLSFTQYVSANANGAGSSWELRSSLDNYTTTIGTGTATNNSQTPTVNFSAANYTNIGAVTFRLYLIKANATTTTWTNENVTLNGTVLPAIPANPTSNAPQCASTGVTLTSVNPPAGQTWYWQTSAAGTSTANAGTTYNVITAGTYYLKARSNATLLWSTGAASLAVTFTPNVGVPTFLLGSTSSRCPAAGTVVYTAAATDASSIAYTLDSASLAGGNTINATTGAVTYSSAWTGTSTITATASGCGPATVATHTVTQLPLVGVPVFSAGTTSVRCQAAATVAYNATATNTTGITYSLDAITGAYAGNSINTATGVVSYAAGWYGTSTITATAAGCTPQASTHTVTTTPAALLPVFVMSATSGRCQGIDTITYSATSANATGISYRLDGASIAGGNSIDTTTGIVAFSGTWKGTSIITATAVGCNGNVTSSHTVTTNAPVTAPAFFLGDTSVRCQGTGTVTYTATSLNTTGITYTLDAASRTGGNTISATGVVTYSSTWRGKSVITASSAGCYGPLTAIHTVTVTPTVGTPIFTLGNTSTRCQGAGTVMYDAAATTTTGITYTLDVSSRNAGNTINATTGEVTYNSTWSGTTIITASAAGCGTKTASHTVTVTPTVGIPVFALGATSTRCQMAGAVTYTASATASTSRIYTLDSASLAGGNTIVASSGAVTYAAAWSGTSVITVTAAGCNGPSTANHTVTITPSVTTPVFAAGIVPVRCQGAGTVMYNATATNTTGITYALDAVTDAYAGNSINTATGVVTYAAGWYGNSTITATAAGCTPRNAVYTATTTATVGLPIFALGSTSSRCHADGTVSYSATATTNTGISYSLDAVSIAGGNSIDSITGIVTFVDTWIGASTITATATGCNGPRSSTHRVTTNGTVTVPIFTLNETSVRCQGGGPFTYAATSLNASGITYTLDLASRNGGNNINATTGVVNYNSNWTGTSVITATAAGCYGAPTATHTVTITPTVGIPAFTNGTAGTSTRCQGAGIVMYEATATTTTGITYALDLASRNAGNTINTSTGAVTYLSGWSGTTIITASAAGCSGPKTTNHTVTITPTVGTPIFSLGATSTRCQGGGTVSYTASATNSTSRSYSLDDASLTGGNYINESTGAVTYAPGWSGTSVITVVATGCNGPSTSFHTVTITPSVGTPVFSLGSTSSRCRAAGAVSYSASATNTSGITYSLDYNSRVAGNTINSTTGAVTFVANFSGTSTITASAAGCDGPEIATHVVTTNAPVTVPVFSAGATSARCQASGTTTYTATSSNFTSITYSLNAASLIGGNTINSTTGAVTYPAGWSGTSIVTATASGCYGPLSATHTVTVNPTVSAPVFNAGLSATRCNGSGSVAYTATATSAITYSLDGVTISGGNTINTSTGSVNYAAGWVGTATITARAAGCGTPAATFTVVSTPSVSVPVFSSGIASTRCQGTGKVTYSASSVNAIAMSYSLDAASITGGNIINAATGEVTYDADWVGTSIITASATGCNGPAVSTHKVTITPDGKPTFALGDNSSRIQGSGNITYTATSSNGASVTYSLDAASLSGGNSINVATGIVTYSATWFGTTKITASVTGCNGVVSSIHTVSITPSSVYKQLYLSDPSQSLDRIDPVATNDATTAVTTVLNNGSTTTFTQGVTMCSPLIIKTGRSISVTNYITITSGSMPSNPAITAVLKYGSTNFISLTNPSYNSSIGTLTWTAMLPGDVTVPAGQAVALSITSAQAGVSFTINFDSKTKPSKIDLPVSTFIDITSLKIYNAPYPGGISINGAVTGSTSYIRATVTDPFGFNDITALNVTITPAGNIFAATSVATSGCTRTYEYVWNSPASAGYYNISAEAKEGFENTVSSVKAINFSNCTDCPPVATNDSATGAGGSPVTIDVLANDFDPNNNLNASSLSIVAQPLNGNVILSNGKAIYLPNGTFAGTDQFSYRICDLTSPAPLCDVATVTIDVDPTIVNTCSESSKGHVYYIPYPEQDARLALIASSNTANLPMASNNIRTIISIKVPYPGMTIVWDHWEDGYEANILDPAQNTTKVWGDGDIYNGIAPGYPNDIIPAGGSIVFDNTMPANPRVAANIFYDGKDKIYSSGEITLTQVLGEPSIIGVQSMKTNVSSTSEFGKSFTIPVGQNFNSQDFKYTALFIRASENNTTVNVDKDNNGTFETTAVLNEGQSLLVGGVLTGATVTGSAPIGVDLHFGGVDNYSSREVPVYPATWYSNVYYTPVPTTNSSNPAVVMMYNNLNRPITINWTSGSPASGSITIPAKQVVRFQLALYTTSTYKFVNPTGESFTAIEIVDSYAPGGGGTSGPDFDWSFNLIAEERLTTLATIAWAPGSTNGTRNDNPIWVTPSANTTIYVKYDGNMLSGGSISPCGLHYDVSYTLNALKFKKLFDTDNDQSGLAVYTCDGTKIAAVYGEDPSVAVAGNPSWDVGTTIKPFCSQKLIFANDDYAYSLTDRAVTIQVLSNDAGFTAEINPSSVTTTGYLQPKHGTVLVNANGTLLYKPNPGFVGTDSLEYSVCSSPSPVVCDKALVIIKVSGCPTPVNRNIISGQVFYDKNKDGLSNDGGTGFPNAKVYLYADGNCNGTIDANELADSVIVDNSGSYQFIAYPEKSIADDFDGAAGTGTCASGTDGNTGWLNTWSDAGDVTPGFCNNPVPAYANNDVDVVKDGTFGYALRLKDNDVSATRRINISGSTAAFLSFSYRKAMPLTAGEDILVQASSNGTTFTTIYTISGNGTTDAGYIDVFNQDIQPFSSASTYIRFVTNANLEDGDEVFIDNVNFTYLKYPTCYITQVAPIAADQFFTTANDHAMTANGGGTCLFPFDYGIAKKVITISGTLFNDVTGLKDSQVNGIATGSPSGNTVYAFLVDSTGIIIAKSVVNGVNGTYSFTAEVNTDYTVVLSTLDHAVSTAPPASAFLPAGWVSTGDAYGTGNTAGTGSEAGLANSAIAVSTGVANVTGVNFGIEMMPDAGEGITSLINTGGTAPLTVPATTFNNIKTSSDPSPGIVSGIRISAFPANITVLSIDNIIYTASNFPAAGVVVATNSTGQPTKAIKINIIEGYVKIIIPFYAVDNAGVESPVPGKATIKLLIDTDKDGIADIIDIDDDNDGITDVIEVCGKGATAFNCLPASSDPAEDNDDDGIVNYKDADLGTLNAAGCIASLDSDGDGIPDFLDLDSDNDGIPDVVEAFGFDEDGDGIIDKFSDTDNDGLAQIVDLSNIGKSGSGTGLGFQDFDGDGIPNSVDLDSDNDGIPDIVEANAPDANNDGIVDNFLDANGNGLHDAYEKGGAILKTGKYEDKAIDVEEDYPNDNIDQMGYPNPYDLDSDGDGITDLVEAGFPGSNGKANGNLGPDGWSDLIQARSTLDLSNSDGRGYPDYLDIDSDDDGISDNIEAQPTFSYKLPSDILPSLLTDINGGLPGYFSAGSTGVYTASDNDQDGIADVYEPLTANKFGGNGVTPYDHDADGKPDYIDIDADNDGILDINEASKISTLTQSNIDTKDSDGDGLLDQFDIADVKSKGKKSKGTNIGNSNMGALGTFIGPSESGSNVTLIRTGSNTGRLAADADRDWRNVRALPLQVVNFTGTYQNPFAALSWLAQNEQDVDYYEVQRSSNGRDFEAIGKVKAINNAAAKYAYTDNLSSYTSSTVYYRLQQVNKAGNMYITNVVIFKLDKKINGLNVFPTPFRDVINVRFNATAKDEAELRIIDATGNTVYTKSFSINVGQNYLSIPEAVRLAKGSYIITVKSNSETWNEKIIKQ